MAIVGGKIRCSACERFLPLTDFSASTVKRGSGTCSKCKTVQVARWRVKNRDKYLEQARVAQRKRFLKNPEKVLSYNKAYRKANPGRTAGWNLKNLYGIGLREYNEIFNAQKGACGICGVSAGGKDGRKFFVDHCHETGVIRGLLCYHCNTGLGNFQDAESLLRRALQYLKNSDTGLVHKDYSDENRMEKRG